MADRDVKPILSDEDLLEIRRLAAIADAGSGDSTSARIALNTLLRRPGAIRELAHSTLMARARGFDPNSRVMEVAKFCRAAGRVVAGHEIKKHMCDVFSDSKNNGQFISRAVQSRLIERVARGIYVATTTGTSLPQAPDSSPMMTERADGADHDHP